MFPRILPALLAAAALLPAAEVASVDAYGAITALFYSGETLPADSTLKIETGGRTFLLRDSARTTADRTPAGGTWRGSLSDFFFEQTVEGTRIALKITAESATAAARLSFSLAVPRAAFAGDRWNGSVALTREPRRPRQARHQPRPAHSRRRTSPLQVPRLRRQFCFNTDSPVAAYTLENLRPAWARVEMNSRQWEPENDDPSPAATNWAALRARDVEGSKLHRDFLLARRIQDKGIPYVISVWRLPELLEHIGSYLLHARQQYGVEPDPFSFNEANIGANVLLSPEEHREAIKSIGAHLRKLGLKTRRLLGDATGPRDTHLRALPAAGDPEALESAGAVAFHSWGGATPAEYAAWGDLAEWLQLPLLVAEVGVAAFAWRATAPTIPFTTDCCSPPSAAPPADTRYLPCTLPTSAPPAMSLSAVSPLKSPRSPLSGPAKPKI